MRKLLAIILTLILLFNVLGFYGLFIGIRYQHQRSQIQLLDEGDYQVWETTLLKIPISIPYVMDQEEYVRVNGEFEYGGEYYRLVKQRYTQDTLHVICIKDQGSKRIHQALSDYVKTFTDDAGNEGAQSSGTFTFVKDYLPCEFSLAIFTSGWESTMSQEGALKHFRSSYYCSIIHPPERA